MRVGVLTASDKASRGERVDLGGPAIRERVEREGWQVVEAVVVPDERPAIVAALLRFADQLDLDVVFTTGGTGLSPRDVTPQATLEVIDYQVPGLAEAMRLEGARHTPNALLSRAVAGVRGHTLIVNLPGSPKGVRESMDVVVPVLPHAVGLLRSEITEHQPPTAS
ncbi:MAG: MogA/MoaB family molybdenum cofactor biosynthesis protein [Chloroflexi bacterium]|nr:MogA/MoaB family molybdenum cofactor biosynthesis protein [Chloroflexota bacterium]